MSEPTESTRLRHAWLRGYRTSDVELALARASLLGERLQHELEAARQRAQAMQTEIDELHNRVDGFRRREAELDEAVEQLRQQRAAFDRDAQSRGDSIVADAERRAAALRTEGLKELGVLQEQVEELLGLRTKLMHALRKAGEGIGRTIEHVESRLRLDDAPPGPGARPADDLADRLSRWTRGEGDRDS
jgi:chromosome segregation ATPase